MMNHPPDPLAARSTGPAASSPRLGEAWRGVRLAGLSVVVVGACLGTPWVVAKWPQFLAWWLGALAVVALSVVVLSAARGEVRLTRWNTALLAVIVGVLATAGFGAINAHTAFDAAEQHFDARQPLFELGPSAVDTQVPLQTLSWIAPIALIGWSVSVLASDRWAGLLVVAAVALAGVLLYLVEVSSRWLGLSIADNARHADSAFGWFGFHGNAGSALVIALMCTAGLALRYRRVWWIGVPAAVGVAGLLACLALINESEAAAGIGALGLCCWLWLVGLSKAAGGGEGGDEGKIGLKRYTLLSLAGLAALGLAGWWLGVDDKLAGMLQASGWRGRVLMWQSAWPIARDAGLFGHGPGSFKLLLPISDSLVPELYRNWIVMRYRAGEPVLYWSHAHNDYLQAIVEWGWLGAIVWIGLLIGAAWRLACAGFDRTNTRKMVLAQAMAAGLIGVMLHALVDLPFQSPTVLLTTALLAGAGWGLGVSRPDATHPPPLAPHPQDRT